MESKSSVFSEKMTHLDPRERELVLKARAFAAAEGRGNEGEGVAAVLLDLNLDVHAVIAGLLIPGGGADAEKIAALFGAEAAGLLKDAAANSRVSDKSGTLKEAETIRNTLFLVSDDYRVLLIMLAAKLAALRSGAGLPSGVGLRGRPVPAGPSGALSSMGASVDTAGVADAEKLKAAAQVCLNVYAPLARRLGISWIKDEMEDLSLKILNREAYRQIKDLVAAKRAERDEFLSRAREAIREAAREAGVDIEVSSRAKHFYSIYLKMRRRNKSAREIFDLFGLRVLCRDIERCYTLLGIAHRLWKPVDGSFKDYIARPKPNGYQSLHTTVIAGGEEAGGTEGRFLEIQIRTREMHHMAEYGVASHWLYKRGSANELARLPEIGTGEKAAGKEADAKAGAAWFEEIRREIAKKAVYVFTPRGKAVRLPPGATPIDFAYSVHSAVGEHCVAAKADGSIIPLHSQLKNTQTVEILTSPLAHPSVNWLETVKTSKARNRIRSWLEKNGEGELNEKNAAAGKKILVPRPLPLPVNTVPGAPQVVQNSAFGITRVTVQDEKNMMVRFARCCCPVSGDPIAGYVSRGRGIIIHRKNCRNLANIPDFAERRIEAEWENPLSALVKRFRVEARLNPGLFSEIEGVTRKYRGSLIEGRVEENDARRLTGFFTVRFEEPGGLKTALKKIRGIPGMLSLEPLN